MSTHQGPVTPIMPSILTPMSRRGIVRGAAGFGLGLGAASALLRAGAQDHEHGTPAPGDSRYVGSDSTTKGDTGDATPAPGEVQPFTPFDAYLKPVTPGPKDVHLAFSDQTVQIAKDVAYAGWTINGTIPGTVIRAVEGDTINVTVSNDAPMVHSVDFHTSRVNPEHGYQAVQPGESFEWSYVAQYPGAYMYHCGTAPVLMHIGAGMYSAMIVDPKEGWEPAQELILIQSEFYVTPSDDGSGVMVPDAAKLFAGGWMDYVVFNGYAHQYVEHPLKVKAGELVRIFVVNCGPNVWSAFHVVGAIFDKGYVNANPKNVLHGLQTISIGPGDGACVELTFDEPGTYVAVNHAFGHAAHGAIALIHAE